MRVRATLTMRGHAPLNNSRAEVRPAPFSNMRTGNDRGPAEAAAKSNEGRRTPSAAHSCQRMKYPAHMAFLLHSCPRTGEWVSNRELSPFGAAKCDNLQGQPNVKYALVAHIQMPHDTLSTQRYKNTGTQRA